MFTAKTLEEVKIATASVGVSLPLSENLEILRQPLTVDGHEIPNRIAIQPMEGCDSETNGAPSELVKKRYDAFAESGAGLIWFEACAVRQEGKANPRQSSLTRENLDNFKALTERIREKAVKAGHKAPVLILQATHSGRYSKPNGAPAPMIAYNNPIFEKDNPIDKSRIVSDDYLYALEDDFAVTADLAEKAGFDGVDIKCCHRYLNSELLSAYNREGAFGGSLENRTRLLRESIGKAKAAVSSDFIVTSRMNIYDGFPYPYGFGVKEGEELTPNMTEPKELIRLLHKEYGVNFLDITIGNPYVNPHVNRPADTQPYPLPEDPLCGVSRMMACIREVKAYDPEVKIIASAFSYLRQFAGNLAAGAIEEGVCDMAGFGRMAFAYPQFANDLLTGQSLSGKPLCITCGKCSQLMRLGGTAGCVIRNPYYTNEYKELTK